MARLFLSPKAYQDLEEIYTHTGNLWGLKQADTYQDDLNTAMRSILSNNDIGITYPFKKGNYRTLHAKRHLIFYRIDQQDCIIIRILHEKMNVSQHLD